MPTAAHRSFRWIAFAVLLGFTLPALVRPGMFMDGLLYLTVAHNLASGFGTFWEPRFSQEGFAQKPWHRVIAELGGTGVENTDHMVTETLIRGMYAYWRRVMDV